MPFQKTILFMLILLTGCHRVGDELHPQINATIQDRYLKSLPSPFPPLSEKEKQEAWSVEDRIALGFAHELDLYQAITSFKRASFLIPSSDPSRKTQLDYDVFLSYYLGGKFAETLHTFETTSLRLATPQLPPYHDLLVMLYDSYLHLDQLEQADSIIYHMASQYPETAQKLTLSKLLVKGDIPALEKEGAAHPEIETLLTRYKQEKKSTQTAQTLNACIPGAGYLYLGQNQSAITAFLLNGLFIWASVYFFQHGNTAAGVIFTSVEAGWYFGGIYGAGQETKFYNERIYENHVTSLMNEHRYFPILVLKYGF